MTLSNFPEPLNVAVIGASGGIGKAFIDHLINQDNVHHIYGFARSACDFNSTKVTTDTLDITNEQTIIDAVSKLDNIQLNVIIVATGMLYDETIKPEKSLRDFNIEQARKIFDINTAGPTLIAKHFLPLIPKDKKSVFAALSARVGSIEDNGLGGWYSYRASKTALNMMLKNISIETTRRYKQACIIGLHPGTVDTNLSEPFQGNVKSDKLFTPEYSAQKLLEVINNTTPDQTGRCFAWDGQVIPY